MSFAYLALYTGDYLRDTRHLTPQKHGVYLLLLMYCWDTRGPVPLDEQECAGIANCRSADEVESLRYVLGRYFVQCEDGWYNERMTKEIEKAEALSKVWRDAGRRGAQARIAINKAKAKPRPRVGQASATTPPPPLPLTSTSTSTPPLPPLENAGPLPPWLPPATWQDYLEHRRAKRARLTPRGVQLSIQKLEKLRASGQDPKQVIEQSIAQGWTGLFALKLEQSTTAPWWTSEAATKAKAAELGMSARAGESWNDFRARIRERSDVAK